MSRILYRRNDSAAPLLPVLDERWLPYRPHVVLLPEGGFQNLGVGAKGVTRVNDVALRGDSYEFPGVNGYIDLGSGSLVARDAHTMVAVCQLDSFPSAYPILASFAAGTSSRITCFFSTDASYSDFSYGGTGGEGTAKVSLTGSGPVLGTMRTIVVVRSGTTAAAHAMFVNGRKLTASTSASHANRTGNNIIGQADTANLSFDFDGRIKAFALFDGLLPDALAAEVSANYAALTRPRRRRLFVVPAAGGTTYNVSLTEAATAADDAAASASLAAAASEPITAADLVACTLAALAQQAEAVAAADAVSTAGAQSAVVAEAVTATDTLAASLVALAQVLEGVSTADTASTGPVVTASQAEPVTLVDLAAAVHQLAAQVAESATAADAIAAVLQMAALITEPATAVDSATAGSAVTHSASITEALALADAIAAALIGSGIFTTDSRLRVGPATLAQPAARIGTTSLLDALSRIGTRLM